MNRNYYKYEFVSAEPIFAKIKEELRSYFATGAIDDIMFPTWVDNCLRRLGKAGLPLIPVVLEIDDFTTTIPENFVSAREVWACERMNDINLRDPSSTYTELSTVVDQSGNDVSCTTPVCDMPDIISVVYKTNNTRTIKYDRQWLLKPGNISTKAKCSEDCFNFVFDFYGRRYDDRENNHHNIFDIHGNKMLVEFRKGHVFMLYYSSAESDTGCQLIPDNYRIQEFIEAYIKYKLFEQLCNQTVDETYNQIEKKKMDYERLKDEAFIMMDIESKKQTIDQKFDSINRTRRRNREYIIR